MLPKVPVLELVQPDQRHFCRNAYVTGNSVAALSHSGGVIVVCVMLGALTLLHRVATAAQATAYHAWGSIRHRHRTRFYRWLARSLAKPTVLKLLECECAWRVINSICLDVCAAWIHVVCIMHAQPLRLRER